MNTKLIRGVALALALSAVAATGAQAQSARQDADLNASFAQSAKSRAMLRMMLQKMPKGGDLHNHAGGGVYAEDYLTWAGEKGACWSKARKLFSNGPCTDFDTIPLRGLADRDADLYSDIIDAISTRRFEQGVGDPTISGHRRFFHRPFAGYRSGEPAQLLAVSLEQAALDNNLYLELMANNAAGDGLVAISLAEPWDEAQMEARLALLAPKIAQVLPLATQEIDATERAARAINACDTPKPKPGCDVTLRYLQTVSRESQPQAVFAQMAYAFALVNADPRYVGVNIAQPEDYPISTRDYSLHMRMFAFFKTKYPKVPLSLHAGELALGLTEPRDMKFHITEAVEIAGAKRIGHGVSVAYEDHADELLARMARDKIAVEINLTSNDVIAGVKGAQHPLALYMAAGVPVAISTDDSGRSRHNMTQEYLRAVTEQRLSYTQLRQISRDSITYSFLEGASLWDPSGTKLAGPCIKVADKPADACATFLKANAKASEQYRLELALTAYEADLRKTIAAFPAAAYPASLRQ